MLNNLIAYKYTDSGLEFCINKKKREKYFIIIKKETMLKQIKNILIISLLSLILVSCGTDKTKDISEIEVEKLKTEKIEKPQTREMIVEDIKIIEKTGISSSTKLKASGGEASGDKKISTGRVSSTLD